MGDGGEPEPADAARGLRAGGAAGRRGHHHARDLPVAGPTVVVFHAQGCHLCERALAIVREAHRSLQFDLREVDIGGDPELEAAYREWLPVVEIDGRRRFTYHVHPESFRCAVSDRA